MAKIAKYDQKIKQYFALQKAYKSLEDSDSSQVSEHLIRIDYSLIHYAGTAS